MHNHREILKKTLSIALSAVLVGGMVSAMPALGAKSEMTVNAASPISINKTNVTLYALEDWAEEYISIPSQLDQTFQLKVTGASSVTYSVDDDEIVEVSKDGLITPKVEIFYWYGWVGTSSKQSDKEPDYISHDYHYGTTTVRVKADDKEFDVEVTLVDYANYYAEQIMDDYISKNISADMSTEEKLNKIAQFVADRDYSVDYQSAAGLIISGGGDCWASTNTVIKMARKIGLSAWGKSRNRDRGAGSGHRNAMVFDGTDYYEVEAGISGKAPRPYFVQKRETLFRYRYNDQYDGYEIYQYDGETVPEELIIPDTINGTPVTVIGDYFVSQSETVKRIQLPSGIKSIGRNAFTSCIDLESLNIPASVEEIGKFSFTDCSSLKNVDASGRYKFINGAIYKDDRILIAVPNASSVTIPSGINEIYDYAFYYNSNIKSVTLPASVEKLGEGVFAYCTNLEKVEIKGNHLKEMSDYIFAYSSLQYVVLPKSVTTIGKMIHLGIDDFTIVGVKGSAAETYASENNITFVEPLENQNSGISKTVINAGASVTVTADFKNGKAPYRYLYAYQKDGGSWTTVKNYSSASSAKITLPSAGNYKVRVKCQDTNGMIVNKDFDVKVNDQLINSSSINQTSAVLGQSFRLTGKASGGTGGHTYAVYYKQASQTSWTKAQDYQSSITAKVTPKAATTYTIRVKAKDSDGNITNKDFTVKVIAKLENNSTINKTSIDLGQSFRLTGKAKGGEGGYTYAVYYKQKTQTTWTKAQDYQSSVTALVIPKAATDYTIRVKLKDANGTVVNKDFEVTVSKAKKSS